MEQLALPILATALLVVVLLGILVGARNPPRFWMDEKRIPDRHMRRNRSQGVAMSVKRTSGRRTD
jgi:hypothetical protein